MDVTTSFTIPTITAPGTYTIQAKDGKFVGTEILNLTAQMSSTGNANESSTPALTSPIDTTAPAAPKITQGTTGSLKNQIFFTVTESNLSTKIYNDANDITSQFLISNSGLNYTLTAKTASFNGTESLNLSVKLSDAIGNVSVASNVLKTTLDTTPPASPSIGVL